MVPAATSSEPLVSCLCVTEDRAAFRPWLLWNYDKQDHERRELVVVDSSRTGAPWPERPDVRVVRCDPGTSVPRKRNLALEAAAGEVVTWFDDDDWQHPRKLTLLLGALGGGRLVAGAGNGWFVDLAGGRARGYAWRGGLLFNSAGVRREVLDGIRFDERRGRGSDTPWMGLVRRRARGAETVVPEPLFFWLCHDRNLSNPARRRAFPHRLDAVRGAVGDEAWDGTDGRLAALRDRLAAPPPQRRPAAAHTPAPARRRRAPPRLCVAITTYDRPDALERLLDDVEREWPAGGGRLEVRIYDDATPAGVGAIEERVRERGWTWLRASVNHGKRDWWRWWNTILADLRRTDAGRFLLIQDDMRLCRDFFGRALDLWDGIGDPRKASLFLHLDAHAADPRPRWTPVRARPAGPVVECGWVDLNAFVCERRLFDAVGWRLAPIPAERWRRSELWSSGVGAQISARLHGQRLTMYRVAASLTVHGAGASLLNPAARRRAPMSTVRFVDGDAAAAELATIRPSVYASLASFPARQRGLESVVGALLGQVDHLSVYLNGYGHVPGALADPRIRVARSQDHGDRGDAGKAFWTDRVHGIHLLCDDDLRYPPDYVERLVAGLERHGRRAVAGFHGALLHERIDDYYRSRHLLHFVRRQPADVPVHVLGTGVCGYHVRALRVRPDDFPTPGMADVWLGLLGQRQRVPFVCLRREAGWLREVPALPGGSIYARAMADTRAGRPLEVTHVARAHGPWRLPDAAPARGSAPAPAPARARAAAPAPPVPLTRVAVRGPSRHAVLALPTHDHITVAVQRAGTYYERDLLDAIRSLAPGGTYVDVGAHYGNHTVYFALECGAARVVALEPNAASFDGLEANATANGIADRVSARRVAVHPTAREVELVPVAWRPRAGSPARTNTGMLRARTATTGASVPAAPLGELLEPVGPVGLVKVDAEGLGREILESGLDVLRRDRPLLAVEAATAEALRALAELLEPLGYANAGRYCWTPTYLWAAG